MLLSVLVTTYNRPDALIAVLTGLLEQHGARRVGAGAPVAGADAGRERADTDRSTLPAERPEYEVIVADDGSTSETRARIDAIRPRFDGALDHVWHRDEGFRAGAIRNRAAARARGEILIFLDGDCIPRPDFIAGHAAAAAFSESSGVSCMVRGSRALLSERFTARVLDDTLPVHGWSAIRWCTARLRGQVNRLIGIAPRTWSLHAGRPSRSWRSVRTCNLAVRRQDFDRVNGFDERYVGWGYEDSDLAIRLLNAGVHVRRAGSACTVLHLWHRENDRRFEGENLARLQATERSGVIRAERGLAEAGHE